MYTADWETGRAEVLIKAISDSAPLLHRKARLDVLERRKVQGNMAGGIWNLISASSPFPRSTVQSPWPEVVEAEGRRGIACPAVPRFVRQGVAAILRPPRSPSRQPALLPLLLQKDDLVPPEGKGPCNHRD